MLTQPKQSVGTRCLKQKLQVNFNYAVHFTKDLFAPTNSLLANIIGTENHRPKSLVAIIDAGLWKLHPQLIDQLKNYVVCHHNQMYLASTPLVVPGGEAAKNDPQLVEQIYQTIEQAGLCRHSYILAIGGGAVIDMVGYAAATAHRGIRLIRIPTTVLAQNDSGIGVKNSINALGKKNFLGTFAPPYAVLNDCSFLHTLSDRDWRSGMAEAVKVALIKDASFFEFIENQAEKLAQRDQGAMEYLIFRCCQLHLEHISGYGDPFEMGSSRPLDFGHWSAHKLEHLSHYRLRHGEAVAIGIALDTTYSYLIGSLSHPEWQQIISTLQLLGFSLYEPELSQDLAEPDSTTSIFAGLREFQEHLGGELAIMLLSSIGNGYEVHEISQSIYTQAVLMLLEIEAKTGP